ncbi:MAG: hypothetical protein IH857_00500 [Deltaproteobacteria bacterium]|nr:hypothetical protein [Deltaproteobacteria bacterium]
MVSKFLVPIKQISAVLGAALLMSWPALYNGFPLLFFGDSLAYLASGEGVARALFLRDFSLCCADRSLIYSLVILPFHWNITPWPIVGLNAILTAYVIWLVVRSLLPRRSHIAYFAVVVLLSVLTGLGWSVSFIMPDILGPVLYLSVYLIAFCWDSLFRGERQSVVLIAWWALASHASHLILAGGLCILVALMFKVQAQSLHLWAKGVGRVVAITLVAALAQLALYTYLFGEPVLFGKQYPFLLARVVTDVPGRSYLQEHCGELDLAICEHVHELPDAPWQFLWPKDGIWQSSSPAKRDQLYKEEMRVVLGTIYEYPWAQLRVSIVHFWHQLNTFGLSEHAVDWWHSNDFDKFFPNAKSGFLQSRHAQQTLHVGFFTSVQAWTVAVSLLVIGIWSLLLRQGWSRRLIGLTAVIIFVVVANAGVTGVLSQVEDRYQCRVIWLVPLLAILVVLKWREQRGSPTTSAEQDFRRHRESENTPE